MVAFLGIRAGVTAQTPCHEAHTAPPPLPGQLKSQRLIETVLIPSNMSQQVAKEAHSVLDTVPNTLHTGDHDPTAPL